MKTTVTLQIGNSDDKLTQSEWSTFVDLVDKAIRHSRSQLHFTGGSYPDAPWQNFCWVFLLSDEERESGTLYRMIHDLRKQFKQDSAAWTEGKTLFV